MYTWEEASRILHKTCAYFSPCNVYSITFVHTGIALFGGCMRYKSAVLNNYLYGVLVFPCMNCIFDLVHKECRLLFSHRNDT